MKKKTKKSTKGGTTADSGETKIISDPLSSLKRDGLGRVILPDTLTYVTESNFELIPMVRQVMPTIDGPPMSGGDMYKQACSSDEVTVNSWKDQWIAQTKRNVKDWDFSKHSAFSEFQKELYKPVICAGSGPSLKKNAHELEKRRDIHVVSCLHNFGYFEDRSLMGKEDYYVNLDAGDITIAEMSEGGKKDEEWYWNRTKDRTLVTHVMGNPELLRRWQGRVLFFSTPTREDVGEALAEFVDYTKVPLLSVGGNCLGAVTYFAKTILGAGTLILIGADFSFDYTHKFHPFDSPYECKGTMDAIDIWGNRVKTWRSYYNFKIFMDWLAATGGQGSNPVDMINATEGGILGAYPEGNIRQIRLMALRDALYLFTMSYAVPRVMKQCKEKVSILF